jgi:predicted secreted protein
MASAAGKEGKVTVKTSAGTATTLASVRSWTVNNTAEVLDATVMNPSGVTYRTNVASFLAWDGSASLLWDDAADAGQALCVPGSTLEIVFYPEGEATGDTTYTGSAIITAVNRTASFDGLVEMEVTFSGTGALTTGTKSA